MKKIIFNKASDAAGLTSNTPAPASKSIPSWYKKLARYLGDSNKINMDDNGDVGQSIKACPPFLDSIINGYMLYTEFDIMVSLKNGEPHFQWRTGGDLVSSHRKSQITAEQVPDGFNNQPFKFINLWQIKTPPGYSVLFTHPLNRTDLPFHTISGIAETDTYKNIINFPFLMKENFEGVIPAGTPIVQLHPFKRESWKMELGEADQKEIFESSVKLNHKLVGGYKTQWWRRKEYR